MSWLKLLAVLFDLVWNDPTTKIKFEARQAPCNTLPTSPVTLESRSPLLPGRCSRQLRKSCGGANMVCSRAEHVLLLEHFFTSKSFAAVCEAFSTSYPDKEIPNETTYWLETKFLDIGSVCLWQVLIERPSSCYCGRTDFKQCVSCNNRILLQEFSIAIRFIVLCVKGFMCYWLVMDAF
jgi:hypothetical protein